MYVHSSVISWGDLMNRGGRELEAGNHSAAIGMIRSALEIGRELGQSELTAFSLRMLGIALNNSGEYEQARTALEESLKITLQIGNIRGQGEAKVGLATAAFCLGEITLAEELFKQSIDIFDGLGDQIRKAMLLSDLGALYCNECDWETALETYYAGLEICMTKGEKHGQAEILVMLGEVSRRCEKLEEAVVCLRGAALRYHEIDDRRNEALAIQYLGLTYFDLGEMKYARQCHLDAMALLLELNELEEVALVKLALGKISQILGQIEDAEKYYLEARADYAVAGSAHGEIDAIRALAILREAIGDEKQALVLMWQALGLLREIDSEQVCLIEADIQRISLRLRRKNNKA